MSKSKYQQQFDEGRSLNWDDLLGWEKEVQEEESLNAATEKQDTNAKSDEKKKYEYKCGKCGRDFKYKIGLNLHIRTGNCEKIDSIAGQKELKGADDGNKKFECDKCGKRFGRKYCLDQHLQTHVAGKNFQCQLCGKEFKLKTYLKMHEKVHSLNGQKNFQCDKCGKKLSRKDHLVGHLKTHEPAKTIQCQICFKNIKCIHEYPQSTNSEM